MIVFVATITECMEKAMRIHATWPAKEVHLKYVEVLAETAYIPVSLENINVYWFKSKFLS